MLTSSGFQGGTVLPEPGSTTEIIDPVSPKFGRLETPLEDTLSAYLSQHRIRLYTHQCDAINRIRMGKNVIITTPTASGKTLAFNLPVFERLENDPETRALYLYPTKALSNDQVETLEQMAQFTGIPARPGIYDGDTPQSKRPAIRENSRIIISNPHELHQVLSWHAKWRPFFTNLKFIVIDEAHRYRGVFGSHIALLLRRLIRLCHFYGSEPQFILSTATLANPLEFAENLTGKTFELVDEDGSPHGRKHFVLYNPFFDGIGERSTYQETKDSCLLRERPTPDALFYRSPENGGTGNTLGTGGCPTFFCAPCRNDIRLPCRLSSGRAEDY